MEAAAKDELKKWEIRCTMCGQVRQIERDWQRCWECTLVSTTRDFVTVPTVCGACCRRRHAKQMSHK